MIRLYATYPNIDDSHTYTVELHDTDYTGSPIEVRMVDQVEYEFLGTSRDPLTKIIPTNARFTILINTQDHQDYIDDLIEFNEGRFLLRVLKDTDVDYVGVILPQQNEMTNRPFEVNERIYSITAVDGLSILKEKPYIQAQDKEYFVQEQDGKFKVVSSGNTSVRAASSTGYIPFNVESYDYGSNYNITTGAFSKAGRYSFRVSLSILGDPADYISEDGISADFIIAHGLNGFALTASLYKIDINTDTIQLTDPQTINFLMLDQANGSATAQRHVISMNVDDHVLLEGETVFCKLSWSYNDAYVRYTVESQSYFESIIDASLTLQNVYDSLMVHIAQIMSQLPTRSLYADGAHFFGINIAHVELSQTTQRGEDYIGITYNAFVTDYNATPPVVVDCYKALEMILDILPGCLIYRSGKYLMHPYRYVEDFELYDHAFTYIESDTLQVSTYPMQCEGRSTTSYLAALRSARYCYNRLSSLNLLQGVAAYFPQVTPGAKYITSDVVIEDRAYRLHIAIRMSAVVKPAALISLQTNGKKWRHAFVATMRIGDDYLKVTNLNSFKQADAIYITPIYNNTNTNVVDIHGPQQESIKEHVIEVSFDLPQMGYSGPIIFGLEYYTTYVRDNSTQYSEVDLSAMSWSLDSLRLSTVDAADDTKIYSAKVCTEWSRVANSRKIDRMTAFSDLWELDNDPAAVVVWNGSAWVRPSTWNQDLSLQALMTRDLAQNFVDTQQVYNGQFIVADYYLGHYRESASLVWVLIEGRYHTHMNRLEGSWYLIPTLAIWKKLNLNTYIEVGDSSSSTVDQFNNLPSSGGSVGSGTSSDQTSVTVEQYEYFTDGENTIYIDIPVTHRLPDPADYSEVQLMRMFAGSKKGSGNMTYRNTLTRAEHFKVDVANQRIILQRAAESGQEFFIMWRF